MKSLGSKFRVYNLNFRMKETDVVITVLKKEKRTHLCAPNVVVLVALPDVACVRLLLVLHSSDAL